MIARKVTRTLVLIFALSLVSTTLLWAQCGTNISGGDFNIGYIKGVSGSYNGHWWVPGGSLKNSGSVSMAGTLSQPAAGYYQSLFSTQQPLAAGCPALTDQLSLVYWQEASAGSTSHAGQFVLRTVPARSGKFQYDDVTNGIANDFDGTQFNATMIQNIPSPKITKSTNNGDGTWTFRLNYVAPTNGHKLYGFYNTAFTPGTAPIQGYKVFYTTSSPATGDPSNVIWSAADGNKTNGTPTVPASADGTDTTSVDVTVTWDRSSNLYFAYLMIFDTGFGSNNWVPYLSANSQAIGPTPANLFVMESASLKKGVATVNWTTNAESGVMQYQAYYSLKKNGTFMQVSGTETAPKGNSSSYSTSFPNPNKGSLVFIKIKASMADGQDQWSGLMKIGAK